MYDSLNQEVFGFLYKFDKVRGLQLLSAMYFKNLNEISFLMIPFDSGLLLSFITI
jgi:hypothetical protein